MEAIILAGGAGTRLREAVPDLPKPMAPIDGRPFLEHQMDYWISQGVERFILSIGYLKDKIKAHFGFRYRDREISYAEEASPLGTGGGMSIAAEKLLEPGPCLVLNGDTFFKVRLSDLLKCHRHTGADVTLAVFEVLQNDRYMGIEVGKDGQILSLDTTRGDGFANGGVYLFDRRLLSDLPWRAGKKFSLETELFPHLLRSGKKLYAMPVGGSFIDIGVPSDYFRASKVINDQG